MSFFLLAFPALFSIVNPLGGAFMFLSATQSMDAEMRKHLARWVAIHSFFILNASIYVGAYVLEFFGISLPVLRVAGGIIIALSAWKLLNAEEAGTPQQSLAPASAKDASRIAFYPLTMPITAGPGTISVAVALGTSRPGNPTELVVFLISVTLVTTLISALVFVLYRHSAGVSRAVGPTGTSIIVRLSAFLLFCIGIQVLWTGIAALLAGVPLR